MRVAIMSFFRAAALAAAALMGDPRPLLAAAKNLPTTLPTAVTSLDCSDSRHCGYTVQSWGRYSPTAGRSYTRRACTAPYTLRHLHQGTIPTQLGLLTQVTLLDLAAAGGGKLLSGPVPTQLGNMLKLADGIKFDENVLTVRASPEFPRMPRVHGSHAATTSPHHLASTPPRHHATTPPRHLATSLPGRIAHGVGPCERSDGWILLFKQLADVVGSHGAGAAKRSWVRGGLLPEVRGRVGRRLTPNDSTACLAPADLLSLIIFHVHRVSLLLNRTPWLPQREQA